MEPRKRTRTRVYTEYDNKYTQEYRKEKKEQIGIDVNKGEKARYKAFCASQGETLASMYRKLMEAEIERTGWVYQEGE